MNKKESSEDAPELFLTIVDGFRECCMFFKEYCEKVKTPQIFISDNKKGNKEIERLLDGINDGVKRTPIYDSLEIEKEMNKIFDVLEHGINIDIDEKSPLENENFKE